MEVSIRRATVSDAFDIGRIFKTAVRELAKDAYSPKQIDIWSSRLSPDIVRDGIVIGSVYVAEVNGEVAGFGKIDIHCAELSMLFVDPAYARKGIGTAILRYLEAIALEQGLDSLTLRASLNAVPFYKSMGFMEVEMITHRIDNVDFECINMYKNLVKSYTNEDVR